MAKFRMMATSEEIAEHDDLVARASNRKIDDTAGITSLFEGMDFTILHPPAFRRKQFRKAA